MYMTEEINIYIDQKANREKKNGQNIEKPNKK